MFSNDLQRKIPGFEEISLNIFLMHKYAQKKVPDPVLFICYYQKLSNETAHKCAQISSLQFLYSKPPENGEICILRPKTPLFSNLTFQAP